MNITLPPRPCVSICLPAARAINQLCVTLTSITSVKASGACSTIFATLLMPEARTRISTPPKRCTAAATILSQCAAELGRKLTLSALAPSCSHSAATFLSAPTPPAAMTRLQPAPASTCAASAPNAPVAPVTIAVLPLTSNSDNGFFRKSSGIDLLFYFFVIDHSSRLALLTPQRNDGFILTAPQRPRLCKLRCRD